MTDWKVGNKDWIKERRENWKNVKRKIDKLGFLDKDEKKALKEYYLAGIQDSDYPLSNMNGGALLELWLHPDKSVKHWDEVKTKTEKSKNRFKYASNKEFININAHIEKYCIDDEQSFFDGLEERLCKYFNCDRLRREDWPELEEGVFLKKAKEELELCRSFDNYLRLKAPNPYDITRYKVNRWNDAMQIAYNPKHKIQGLDWMIEAMCAVLNAPDSHHELVVNMANEINDVINDSVFPEEARELINKHKKKYGCPE